MINKIEEIRGITNRIAMIKVEIGKSQIYTPKTKADEEEVEECYNGVRDLLEGFELTRHNVILMGKWNSQIGMRDMDERKTMGKYDYGRKRMGFNTLLSRTQHENQKHSFQK